MNSQCKIFGHVTVDVFFMGDHWRECDRCGDILKYSPDGTYLIGVHDNDEIDRPTVRGYKGH